MPFLSKSAPLLEEFELRPTNRLRQSLSSLQRARTSRLHLAPRAQPTSKTDKKATQRGAASGWAARPADIYWVAIGWLWNALGARCSPDHHRMVGQAHQGTALRCWRASAPWSGDLAAGGRRRLDRTGCAGDAGVPTSPGSAGLLALPRDHGFRRRLLLAAARLLPAPGRSNSGRRPTRGSAPRPSPRRSSAGSAPSIGRWATCSAP